MKAEAVITSMVDLEPQITDEEINEFLKQFAKPKIAKKKILEILASKFAEIEKEEKIVTDIVMNAKTFADFRKFHDEVDTICDGNLLKKGLMAFIWGARLWVNKNCLDNVVKIYSDEKSLKEDFPELQCD